MMGRGFFVFCADEDQAMKPAVAIIGASTDQTKYGNKALRAYRQMGYEVYPIHPTADAIEDEKAYPTLDAVPRQDFERVSFYVPPSVGLGIIDQVARKQVDEVWLNPGAESPELEARGRELGLNVVVGCSILAVGVSPAEL
jgi:predicted CoA-binding protein